MPNWCSNSMTIRSKSRKDLEEFIARASSGEHNFVGPFTQNLTKDGEEFDWGAFTPIYMEMLMQDDDLFRDKSGRKSKLCFHAFVPVPREVMLAPYDERRLEEEKEKYPEWFDRFPDLLSGYQWEHQNWGVKWGANDAEVSQIWEDREEFGVDYHFDTPWGPPREFLIRVAKMYPQFSFRLSFEEGGMGFGGMIGFEDGEMTECEDWDLEESEEEEEMEEE